MNRIIIKDTFREISKTKGRFFSIFAIVALGVAFFGGITGTAPIMKHNADKYFDDYNLMDYRIVSNFGITEEDVIAIEKQTNLLGVMPAYLADVLVKRGNVEIVVRIHSFDLEHSKSSDPNYINQLKIIEGRLPQQSGEIVVEQSEILQSGLKIGDKITIQSGTEEDILDTFNLAEYTVVGLVNSPYYLSYEKGVSTIGSGTVNLYAYIPKCDFNMDVYTEVFVTVQDVKSLNSYTSLYFDKLESTTINLENLGDVQSELRREEILEEAIDKYNEGLLEYQDGVDTFDRETADAEKKIEEGKFDLLAGEMTLQSNKDITQLKFDNVQTQIDSSKAQVALLNEQYKNAEEAYLTGNADVLARREEIQVNLNNAQTIQGEKRNILDDAVQQLEVLQAKKNQRDTLTTEVNTLNYQNTLLQADLTNSSLTVEEKQNIQSQIDANNLQISQKQNLIVEIDASYPHLNSDISIAQQRYQTAQNEYDTATTEVNRYQAQIDLIDQGLSSVQSVLNTLKTQIDSANLQIVEGEKQLAEGKVAAATEFANAQVKLDQGKIDLEEAEIELDKEKAKVQEELDDAYDKLVKAKNDIDKIEEGKWFILDRESHYGYMDYKGAADRMASIAQVFPVFFFLVAALVCLTTMTRMVDEQRSQIGTMKALGYPTSEIAFKYVFYAAMASLSGSVLGLLIGMSFFPSVIYIVWLMMYVLPSSVQLIWQVPLMLTATGIAVVVITTAAFVACYKELIETPSLLMRPKSPKLGKKILIERFSLLWKHFSFTSKVTARNIFRYKKRFFMTVIGISGCTALLIAGFGIKDSIGTIVEAQFSQIFQYDGFASLTKGIDETRKQEIVVELQMKPEIDDVMLSHSANAIVYFENRSKDVNLTVMIDGEKFNEFISLHERESKKEIPLTAEGVVISERMATDFGIKVDDQIALENEDGIRRTVIVKGICENYIDQYVYLSSSYYKATFDIRALANTMLIKKSESFATNDSLVASAVSSVDGIDSIGFYSGLKENFNGMISSLNLIVVILVVCAGALAFVVLYNLTNVNISERMREIATLKVLGFHDKEVNAYVYKENIILTLVGALVGAYLGKLLHLFIMIVVEMDNLMFGRQINGLSYVYSVLITVLFAMIVNRVMAKKLRNIPMVESLKSVE